MYLLFCFVAVNKYGPWGEGPFGVGMADGPLSRPTRRCPGHWPIKRGICPTGWPRTSVVQSHRDQLKEAFAQSTGTLIPGLGFCRLAAYFRGTELPGPVSSTWGSCQLTARPRDAELLEARIYNDEELGQWSKLSWDAELL